jgi:uncharacterized protein YbjT (DUF2867 family)
LREAGHEVVAMSRQARTDDAVQWRQADLSTGDGLERAVDGVDAIAHLASSPYKGRRTQQTDVDGTARLCAVANAAGVGQVVYTSIVGVDQIPWKYLGQKLAAEGHVRGCGVPWSIVRATQFYPAIDMVLRMASRLPVLPMPTTMPGQPVDIGVVAALLAHRIAGGPSGDIVEIGGPEVLTSGELARTWLEVTGRRRLIVPLRVPGKLGRAFRAGDACTRDGEGGGPTWRQWLEAR